MAVGLATIFAGYNLAYFGYCSIKGPGVGFLDLLVPGRFVVIPGPESSNPNIPNASNTPLSQLPKLGTSANTGTGANGDPGNTAPGFPGGPTLG